MERALAIHIRGHLEPASDGTVLAFGDNAGVFITGTSEEEALSNFAQAAGVLVRTLHEKGLLRGWLEKRVEAIDFVDDDSVNCNAPVVIQRSGPVRFTVFLSGLP